LHELSFVALRAFDAHGDGPRIFALWVAGAANELTESAVLLDQSISAKSAFFVQRLVRLMRDARSRPQTHGGFAIGIAAARQECPEAPALKQHFLAAILTIFGLALGVVIQLRRHVLDEIAIRIARATEKESVPADALQQLPLPALLTGLAR